MGRVIIQEPKHYLFSTSIALRITDMNYENHLGNDSLVSLLHELRMRFLSHFGYTEMDLGGINMIMGDLAIAYKSEAHYGDTLSAEMGIGELKEKSFELIYCLKHHDGRVVALAKTGMVGFDYKQKKVCALPREVVSKFSVQPEK